MKRNLIKHRLAMASKADYTNALDVQNYIQNRVNYEAFVAWCRKDEDRPLTDDPFCQKADWSFRKFLAGLSALIP